MSFYLLNSLPGKGKTEFAINEIVKEYQTNPNLKVLFVVPTKELQNQIKTRLEDKLPPNHKINILATNEDTIHTGSVKSNVITTLKGLTNYGSVVLIITSSTLTNLYNQSFKHFNTIFLDEEIQPMKQYIFKSTNETLDKAMRIIISGLLVVKQSSHEDYYEVFFKDKLSDGYVDQYISNMGVLQDATQSNKTVLCLKEAYDAYVEGTIDTISFTVIENVLFTQNADKTYFMGFDLKNSEMVKLYEKIYGVKFADITSPQDLKYQNEIHIYYLSDKNIGNSKLMSNEEYQSIIVESYKNHLNQNTLICDFNFTGYDKKKYNFDNIVPAKSHGLNKDEWTMKTDVAIFAHFRHSPEEMKFLSKMGFSRKDADRAREGNILIQIMARSAIRKQGNTLTTNLFLIDKRSAEVVKEMLGDSNVTLHKVAPVRSFPESNILKADRKNKANVSIKEKSRMGYLRRKKREKGSISAAEENELASLILKMDKF